MIIMIPLHHSIWDGKIIESILIVVLCISLAVLIVFSVFWFKFKIWAGTKLGQTALVVNFALMILAIVEILNVFHLDLGGYLKTVAWILVAITIVLRTIYMLQGKTSYNKADRLDREN